MTNARDRLNAYVTHESDEDQAEFARRVAARDAEVLRQAADKLTIREATPLWDAINNVLLAYGFFNPRNSVPETEKVFGLVQQHLRDLADEAATTPAP